MASSGRVEAIRAIPGRPGGGPSSDQRAPENRGGRGDRHDSPRVVIVEHQPSGTREEIATEYLFVFIGSTPATSWLGPKIERDERGYLLTGSRVASPDSRRQPLETSEPGVVAVGDARSGSVKRMSAAIGEGASVVKMVYDYLETGGSRF